MHFRPDWESIYEKTFDEKFGDPEFSSDGRAKYLLDELIKSKDNTEKEYFTVPVSILLNTIFQFGINLFFRKIKRICLHF